MRNKYTIWKSTIAILFVVMSQTLMAQNAQNEQSALTLLKKNAAALGLTDQKIINSRVSDTYVDVLSGATLVYLQQTYMGIDIDKSVQVFAFKNGSLVSSAGKRVEMSGITNSAFTATQKKLATPSVGIEDAVRAAAKHLQIAVPLITRPSLAAQDFSKPTDFGDLGIAREKVTSRLIWIPQKTFQKVQLVWEVNVAPKKTSDAWRVFVDAKTGNVIKKENYTVYDNWKQTAARGNFNHVENITSGNFDPQKKSGETITSATYRVVPFPAEAPSFPGGTPSLVTDPWELSPAGSGATPFIWNDDGSRQYKYSRGNNVLAQEDQDANDSTGKRAAGTTYNDNLYFDFMPRFGKPPTDSINQGFAITNLFYWNNIMHDLSYQYGFDEASGNFQQNNLGRGGKGYDFVDADAQDGISLNNANFYTPPDGQNPRMQMFLFEGNPKKGFKINSPESIAKRLVSVEGAVSPNNLLASVGSVTADVVLYNNASDPSSHNACSDPANAKKLNGKIAMINRGTCLFVSKILNAQKAGAIAVIMVDSIPGEPPFTMGGLDESIVIPAVMISYEDGLTIQEVLSKGTAVNVTLSAPQYIDGDLDNGVICHEYTHGISNRLTGGPSNVFCLQNAEEMGEGWSDYIALMHTTNWSKANNNGGAIARGLGTYVLKQPPDGPGIRQYPYTTDMTVNPHTYADVAATGGEPHAVGEIWASILWDMTWFIIKDEGINKDIFNSWGAGGNTTAYKLVMEGMKLQPCSPGFVDGRDAILKADTLLYGGAHACAIWKAFARRGVGAGASQGSSEVAGDEMVDFKQSGISITKHGPKKVSPGQEIEYTIGLKAKAVCSQSTAENFSVTDPLPLNVTYVSSDGKYNAGARTVSFNNISLADGDSITYKIKVKVNGNTSFPDSVYLDDDANHPEISDKWKAHNGTELEWSTLDLGIYFYYSNDASVRDASKLVTADRYIIPGVKTTFSFWHEIISDDFKNGAVIEITADSGKTWQDLGPYMDPGGFVYNEPITGNSHLNGRWAFAGFGFGTTTIDLSSFAGKSVRLRFLYATSEGSFSVPDGGTGWIIDDILLSASASVSNTAWLYYKKDELKGYSTVETKIKGKNLGTDFIAIKRNESEALLTWQQPGELNGGYQVERSTDNGISFTSIGTIRTRGENTVLQSYDFSDAAPAQGINLYRIQHTGSSGAVDYSEAKAVIFDKAIGIYPNPAKDKLNISIPGNNKTITLQLTDNRGSRIKSYKATGENIQLNLPALASGTYYINIIKTDGTSRHKIVIE
ncbi:MAG TPA: M36 family metallopeptidase [Parafilimonas sp.]|nr:M36 family metallopeptidase [Parafilimonas sp.]